MTSVTTLLLCLIAMAGGGGGEVNAPPVLVLDRIWTVMDTEQVGSVVTRVRGSDSEGAKLRYGLELREDLSNDQRPLPFRIDENTGVVYTNQSLTDRTGKDLYLYVTVTDGSLTQKSEVWVKIVNSSDPESSRGPRPPPGIPRYQMGFGQRPILPPFPGNPGRPPQLPVRPRPPVLPPVQQLPVQLQPTTEYILQENSTAVANSTDSYMNTTTEEPVNSTTHAPTTARLPPHRFTTYGSTSPPGDLSSSHGTTSSPLPTPTPAPTAYDLALTIVPMALVGIMFGLAAIAVFLFRKRICKYKKSTKKDELKKTSNGLRGDSMVMQQWVGPRARKNRYEGWDPDTPSRHNGGAESAEKPVDRWEFPRHQLKVFNILGEGCFGQVWRCEAKNIDGNEGLSVVAVKTLKENAGEAERRDLLQELAVMKTLDPHPNVVRLLGCCTDKDPIFVIMEYVTRGKLQSFLRNSRAQRSYDNLHGKSSSLTSRHLTSFCHQVARGMQYLASKGIIHRDLAARNVLVAEDLTCKVADFGFARDVTGTNLYERKSEGRLPIRWMAPESLYDNIFTVKSDVWSLGVLVWEVVTLGSTPYPGLSGGEVLRKVRDGYRLEKPEHCRRELYNIMYYCWDKDPTRRPDFSELVTLLEQLLLTETDYIELQAFPDHSYYNISSLSGEKL